MTTATIPRPLSFGGAPLSAWAFGIRIWVAVVIALAASFWLELEAPSSAALTVAILAAPTRGQALEKACFRLLGTAIGVTTALAVTAVFSQTRDLILAAFAGWIGLCVFAAELMDGNRAYAAVLSGYTLALIAIQQLDTPQHVFESSVARGAAIAVGIAAVAFVNDLLAAPDSFPRLASQLAALHRRVRDYAKPVPRDKATYAATAAGLLRDIAALRPEITSLATELASGSIRSAAARSTAVALVAAVHAARVLNAVFAATNPAMGDTSAATLRSPALATASREFLGQIFAVREGLAALNAGHRLHWGWRMPLYRSRAIAAAAGLRAAAHLVLASGFFVLAGWPSAEVSLSLVALVIGLGAVSPNSARLHRRSIYCRADRGGSGGDAGISDPRRRHGIPIARTRARALRDRHDGGGDNAASHGRVARSAQSDLHSRHSISQQPAVLRRTRSCSSYCSCALALACC